MADDFTLICPVCHQGQLLDKGDGMLTCPQCGERFIAPQRVCPYCDTINDIGAQTCARCGKRLLRTCPRCGTLNSISAAQCASCGQRFDMIGHIAAREELRYVDRFTHHAEAVSDVRAVEEAQSQQRIEQFWEEDRRRRAALAAQRQEQKRQELRLMYGAIAFVVVAIIIIIVIVLLTGHI